MQAAQTAIAEAGVNLQAFLSEKRFANWLGLRPTNETSGGKVRRLARVNKVGHFGPPLAGGGADFSLPQRGPRTSVRPPANDVRRAA